MDSGKEREKKETGKGFCLSIEVQWKTTKTQILGYTVDELICSFV